MPNRRMADAGHIRLQRRPCGIIRGAALWTLCRIRHKTHWTGNGARLDRDFGRKRWGDEGYALEELVAELGAAFLCADLGITPEVREDHAAYIGSWLQALQNDKRCIFTAAAHAQRAVDFLLATQPTESVETETTEPVDVEA